MGRYHATRHDTSIKCENSRCGVLNAPDTSPEYDPECWRCGEPLDGKPEVGDVVSVDIVDVSDGGVSVGKTDGGFVLFLDRELSTIEAEVRVTEVSDTAGQATVVD